MQLSANIPILNTDLYAYTATYVNTTSKRMQYGVAHLIPAGWSRSVNTHVYYWLTDQLMMLKLTLSKQ
jgi:hypothetical protein